MPVKNKMFVLNTAWRHLSVFDTTSSEFVLLTQTPKFDVGGVFHPDGTNTALVGGKMVVIQRGSKALCYDVEGNEWVEKDCPVARDLEEFSCLRVPKF